MVHTKYLIIGIRPCDMYYPIRGDLIGQTGRGLKDKFHRWYDPTSKNELAQAMNGSYHGDFRLDKEVNGTKKYIFLAVDLKVIG